MSDMSMPTVENAGMLFNGIAFSPDSTPTVPTLHKAPGEEGSTRLVGGWQEFHTAPVAILRFMRHLIKQGQHLITENKHSTSVRTRWGEGLISFHADPRVFSNYLGVGLGIIKVAGKPQEELSQGMRLYYNPSRERLAGAMKDALYGIGTRAIVAGLSYASGTQFAVRQRAEMEAFHAWERRLDVSSGIAVTEIAFGLKELKRAAELGHAQEEAQVWKLIAQSIATDGITPTTAFHAANLIPGKKVIPPITAVGNKYTIETLERLKERRPSTGKHWDTAVATISFTPAGKRSTIFGRRSRTESATLEVRQIVPVTPAGIQQPYASIITGGLIAASKMRPTTFPLSFRAG